MKGDWKAIIRRSCCGGTESGTPHYRASYEPAAVGGEVPFAVNMLPDSFVESECFGRRSHEFCIALKTTDYCFRLHRQRVRQNCIRFRPRGIIVDTLDILSQS